MNSKTLISALIAIVAFFAIARPVAAQDGEAGSAAALIAHQIELGEDTRTAHLESFLVSYNSPIAKAADHFIAEADRLGMDWRLVAAIAGVESTFGKHIPVNSFNAWGWGIPTGHQSGIGFDSWEEGITAVSEGLKYRYIDKGAVTIEQIGRIYAASPAWPAKVKFFLAKIDAFEPTGPEHIEITL